MDRVEEYLDMLQKAALAAENELYEAVLEACPGPHVLKQHRDRMPPWCETCQRTARGVKVVKKERV